MTQEDANEKFTASVNRVLEELNRIKPIFDDYKAGEESNCSASNAEDAVALLESIGEELEGAKDDFQSIVDEDIEEDIEDEEYEDTADLRPSDADVKEAEGEHNDE